MFSGCVQVASAKASKLSELLTSTPPVPPNPFSHYARYDGAHCVSDVPVKRIRIFVHPIFDDESPAVQLVVISAAKVSDVIGLVCWHYTNQGRRPPLPYEKVDAYSLLFAEEDGEYDFDFPCLDKSESIAKFHFTSLALVLNPAKIFDNSAPNSAEKVTDEIIRVTILPNK